mgnify:CR=1 FL=1
MIEQLIIKNFAIIEDLEVSFENGFTCLCGETGAGKSIIIDAINLLLGERSSFDKIRYGKQKAFIEGLFRVDNELKQKLNCLLDDDIEDDMLVLTRTLDINNKSICKINSHVVSLNVLKNVSSLLIEIHSSQKDQAYLHEENQLNLLDNFIFKQYSNTEKDVFNQYKKTYVDYLSIKKEYNLLKQKQNNLGEIDYLIYQKNELENANIKENEMENLEEEKNSLASFSRQSEKISNFLNDYQNISSSLYNAKKNLSYINEEPFDQYNEKFNDLYYQLEDLVSQINDDFESKKDSLIRLEEINDRLYFLHSLRKKYGYTTSDILSKLNEIKQNIDELENYDDNLLKYENKINELKNKLLSLGNDINTIREKYSLLLSKNVNKELQDLYLENAEFKINILKTDNINDTGIDEVKFLLKANKGSNFVSLEKTASLGETSRLNLALRTVFNSLYKIPTIIFDEIDIGLSGRVGLSISKKMKEISLLSQVITISHLPQVIANADHLYLVSKDVINNITYSNIKQLNENEKLIEVSKMMTGNDTDTSKKAAQDLINYFK